MDFAYLRSDVGQRTKIIEWFVSIKEGFTEGFDTVNLKEAKEVLDRLS